MYLFYLWNCKGLNYMRKGMLVHAVSLNLKSHATFQSIFNFRQTYIFTLLLNLFSKFFLTILRNISVIQVYFLTRRRFIWILKTFFRWWISRININKQWQRYKFYEQIDQIHFECWKLYCEWWRTTRMRVFFIKMWAVYLQIR